MPIQLVGLRRGLRCDQTIRLTGAKTAHAYPQHLRRVVFYDHDNDKRLAFLTNNFDLPALTIAQLYKCRWQVELFFKWIKQHLRKLKGHGLIERDGSRYAYRLTPKGVQVALLFLFFHKRLCGPLANSRFHHEPDPKHRPQSQLETAYHRADKAIQQIVELLAAA